MSESVWAGHKRRTEAAIVAAGLELFAGRGFEGTTVDQIAAAAGISRRTFFRYFADKEELFFAEDERLLQVVEDTLDGASPGEPVLDLARRATRALACFQAAYERWVRDPGQDLPALVDDSFAALAGLVVG